MNKYPLAVRYINNLIGGIARPILFQVDDGRKFVVKFSDKATYDVLITDYFCSKLGQKLGLPIPNVEVIEVPSILLDIDPSLSEKNYRAGLHFGSEYVENAVNFIGPHSLNLVENKHCIPDILGFDLFISNDDRANNPGNLLIDHDNNLIRVIDQGNAFNGPMLTIDELSFTEYIYPPEDGEVILAMKGFITSVDLYESICVKIESLSREEIVSCFDGVPSEWGLSNEIKEAVVEYLEIRKTTIRSELISS